MRRPYLVTEQKAETQQRSYPVMPEGPAIEEHRASTTGGWADVLDAAPEALSGSEIGDENLMNTARLKAYQSRFSEQFLRAILESEFEFGCDTVADSFLRNRLAENAMATKEWVNSLFISHYHDTPVVVGILRTIAHLDYQEINPEGPTMALAALAHRCSEAAECAIRCFENWGAAESLETLRSLRRQEPWLAAYVQRVISDLEEALSYESLGQKS